MVLFKVLSGSVTYHRKSLSPTLGVAYRSCLPVSISVIPVSQLAHSATAQNMGKTSVDSLSWSVLPWPRTQHSIPFLNCGNLLIPLFSRLGVGETQKTLCLCWRRDKKHYAWHIDDLKTLPLVLERPPGGICLSDRRGHL